MLIRKRLLHLAEKYGPFMRFFPEGSEDGQDGDGGTGSATDAGTQTKAEAKTEVPAGYVPEARLKDLESQLKAANEKADLAMGQLRMSQANPPAAPAQTGPQKNIVDTIIDRHFDEDDEVVGRDQMKACLNDLSSYFGNVISNIHVMQTSPNYSEVVGKYFPEIVKGDPEIAQAFNMLQAQSPALASRFAYKLCVKSQQYISDHTEKKDGKMPEQQAADEAAKAAAEEAIKAATNPPSASQAGGGGMVDFTNQVNELAKDPEKFDKWTDDYIAGRIKI